MCYPDVRHYYYPDTLSHRSWVGGGVPHIPHQLYRVSGAVLPDHRATPATCSEPISHFLGTLECRPWKCGVLAKQGYKFFSELSPH